MARKTVTKMMEEWMERERNKPKIVRNKSALYEVFLGPIETKKDCVEENENNLKGPRP